MSDPTVAGTSPIVVELEKDKNYAFCACGASASQPFCDGSHSGSGMKPKVFTAEKNGPAYLCMCKRTANAPFCDGAHKQLK